MSESRWFAPRSLLMWCLCLCLCGGLLAADDDAEKDKPASSQPPPALTHYMGREIARTMHYIHADWLTRTERQRQEGTKTLLKKLDLRPGMVVCDMGCGNGYYTLPMAAAVGEKGKVFAVDIQVQMLHFLKKRAKAAEIGNIEYVLGELHDPKLPPRSQDLILLVDTYHEFSHPVHMLKAMREALKPEGVVVLVEFRAEDPDVPILPQHKMSKKQIMKEFPANGFALVEQFDKLPWQHVMFFKRDDAPSLKKEEDKKE